MKLLLAVAAGGAAGALARYAVYVAAGRLIGHGFPWATLVVNVAGSLILGALVELMALRWQVSPELRVFLVTGLLGAFTTFSTFSLDTVALAERGAWLGAGLYVGASVALSVAAFLAGMRMLRMLLA